MFYFLDDDIEDTNPLFSILNNKSQFTEKDEENKEFIPPLNPKPEEVELTG